MSRGDLEVGKVKLYSINFFTPSMDKNFDVLTTRN